VSVVQAPGTLQVLQSFASPTDIFYISFARWHYNNCEGVSESYLPSLEAVGKFLQVHTPRAESQLDLHASQRHGTCLQGLLGGALSLLLLLLLLHCRRTRARPSQTRSLSCRRMTTPSASRMHQQWHLTAHCSIAHLVRVVCACTHCMLPCLQPGAHCRATRPEHSQQQPDAHLPDGGRHGARRDGQVCDVAEGRGCTHVCVQLHLCRPDAGAALYGAVA
jgi:hypothetical protein